MKSEIIKQELYEYISNLEIIDCHEHLIDESAAVSQKADFSLLVDQYNRGDFLSAGMKQDELDAFYDPETDLDRKWKIYEKWYQYVEDTSYMKASKIVLEHDFGVKEITRDNYRWISEELQKRKQPGYYKKVFKDCGIQCALNDDLIPYTERFPENTELLKRVVRTPDLPSGEHFVTEGYFYNGVTCVSDLQERAKAFVDKVKSLDNKGLKLMASGCAYIEVSETEAASEIQRLLQGGASCASAKLYWYVSELVLREAEKADLPVSVHTGYWGDYRDHSLENYIPLFFKYPNLRFDVFHLGYPLVKQSLLLAKTFPNVNIDLCWTYIISQQFAYDSLCQMIDFLPRNKVMGFGGDFINIERVYGHRIMMNETVSKALAAKVEDGSITLEKAKIWARAMLVENPKAFYNV